MLLPLVLWGPSPPAHTVTHLLVSRCDKVLITASMQGQLVVWDISHDDLTPRSMLVGHSESVVGLDQVALGLTDIHIISVARNGEVYKWNINDGSLMTSTTLQGPLTNVKVLPSSQGVLVAAHYGAIHILDPMTLELRHLLVPSDPTHWVLCLTIFQPPKTNDEEVVCLTINGQVKTWHLQHDSKEKMILESETKMLTCANPISLTYNPHSLYNCLIVCDKTWRIYRAGDFVLLCSDSSNQDVAWAGGLFMSVDTVLLWRRDGVVNLFKLPARAIRPVDHTDTSSRAEPATCLMQANTGQSEVCVLSFHHSQRTLSSILLRGEVGGAVTMWRMEKELDMSKKSVTNSLVKVWNDCNPAGIIDRKCNDCEEVVEITSSVSLEPLSYIACGLSTGGIVVGSVSQLAKHSLSVYSPDWPSHRTLEEHRGSVTALIFPYALQPTSYNSSHLYSGGADFSVKIWDWSREQLLQSFPIHSGPVTKFCLPPPDAPGRLGGSVVSICTNNSVAITKPTDTSPLFSATCQHTTIKEVRWRITEDILLVICEDDTVYVWGLSTGHLDRVESGSIALNIISASPSPEQANSRALYIPPPGSLFPKQTSGLSLIPFKLAAKDNFSHILVFDTELLLHLLSQLQGDTLSDDEEVPKITKTNTFEMLKKRVAARAESRSELARRGSVQQTETAKILADRCVAVPVEMGVEPAAEEAVLQTISPERVAAIKDTCALLLSCLHAWGVDETIDSTCLKHLGLFAPCREVSYGTISSNSTLMLLIPGWEKSMEQQCPDRIHRPYGRWCISSSMTTQHLLSVSALANKQMSTDLTFTFNHHVREASLKRYSKDNIADCCEREELLRHSINESEKKAGWSHVTALHCIVLPERVPSGYCSPLLPHLAVKWQDRCMEVREASQALFLRELRRIGFSGRQQLVNEWYPYIVRRRDLNAPEPLEKIVSTELPRVSPFTALYVNTPVKSVSSVSLEDEDTPSDSYAISVIVLGVLVAEFGSEVELKNLRAHVTSPDRREAIKSSFLLTHDMLKMLSYALMAQLTQTPTVLPLHSPLRRAAVDLIGRGFSVWGEFMNLTAVIMTLLELQTDPSVSLETKKAIAQSGNLPGTGNKERLAAASTVRAAYQASILIANSRPQHLINCLSKEIMTFKSDQEAGLTTTSTVLFPSSNHVILSKAKCSMLLLVKSVLERGDRHRSRDVTHVLCKVVEIVLFCIDTEQFKTRTLGDLVPSLTRNPLIDYCASTQQVAVGSAEGLVHMFDIKTSKCHPLHAHSAAITCLSLSPNGRALITYSEREGKVTIWQSSAGILSLMSPGPLKLVRSIETLPVVTTPTNKVAQFKWDSSRSAHLCQPDGSRKLYTL